jgi:molecular chaperone DnaK
MGRIKYGIDLGTTNSAIAVLEKGESTIKKNELQKDTTPSTVGFRKGVVVGDKAFNQLNSDKLAALKKGKAGESNVFVEFKRTMGSDSKYHSSKMDKDFSSEDLSAEVLKYLKSKVQNENFKSVVITIPAMFNDSQKIATISAANKAGFSQVELLQEPIAAASAYGLDEKTKDGKILIFDFGGGTFDVCLVDIEDGIMQVKDTEGDNWLGGKNLDNAIVDDILIPYLKENYAIDSYLNDEVKNNLLREALKIKAEEIKINLSFSKSYDVISNLGEYPEDDEGEEIEIDLNVTHDQMKNVLGPVFQKAIDLTIKVLERNNLSGDKISNLILVGGPTFSPVLREMMTEQICKPNTSVDPMTVVARGAAIYASQFEVDDAIKDEVRDDTKIQLELHYESQSVDVEENLVIQLNKSKTKGEIPEKLLVSVKRSDGGWESEKVEINETGDIIELQLKEGKPNNFEIVAYDQSGTTVACEPNEITILQGVKTGNATLAYHVGVGLLGDNGKENFYTIPGLGKNVTMPASGEMAGLKTQKDLRPGTDDFINISIYQGSQEAVNTRAVNQLWVSTVPITGNDISKFLPKGSDVSLFLECVKDGEYKLSIDIPFLNETIDKETVQKKQEGEDDNWFNEQFRVIEKEITTIKSSDDVYDADALAKIEDEIKQIKNSFEARKSDNDTRMQTRDNIKKQFANLDDLQNRGLWPSAEQELKDTYYKAEELLKDSTNSQHKSALERLKSQMDNVLKQKDVVKAKDLTQQINWLQGDVLDDKHGVELYISVLVSLNEDFNSQPWSDKSKARSILDRGLKEAMSNPSKDRIMSYCRELWALLPDRKSGTDTTGGDVLSR